MDCSVRKKIKNHGALSSFRVMRQTNSRDSSGEAEAERLLLGAWPFLDLVRGSDLFGGASGEVVVAVRNQRFTVTGLE